MKGNATAGGSTRRAFLVGGVGTAAAGLAGCLGVFDEERRELQVRVEQLQEELADLEVAVERERSEREALEAEVESLEAELAAEREHAADLEAALAEERAETEQLRAEIEALEASVEQHRHDLEHWNMWGFSEETLSALQRLATDWIDSVVAIDVITDDGRWSVGTGWVFEETVVATNAHVVRPERLPTDRDVQRYDVWTHGGTSHTGLLLGYSFGEDDLFDSREDVAFLEVPRAAGRNRGMERGVSRELEADEPLLQIGHPWSLEYWTPSVGPFVTHREPFFVSNVPGQPGVSGAPVLDLEGDVVGMTWGGHYHRAPQRSVGIPPAPGDGTLLTSFEEGVNGIHSYMHRIETAFDHFS